MAKAVFPDPAGPANKTPRPAITPPWIIFKTTPQALRALTRVKTERQEWASYAS